jgi:hypothetical protein
VITNLTKSFVARECRRAFAAIPLLASLDDAGKLQIVETLLDHCQSDEHVTATLRQFVENALNWHNPVAELVAIARATYRPDRPPPGCPECEIKDPHQIDWVPFVIREVNGRSVGMRCACDRGRWLAARDRERISAEGSTDKNLHRPPRPAPKRTESLVDVRALAAGNDR